MRIDRTTLGVVLAVLSVATLSLAQGQKVENVGPPQLPGLSDALKAAVAEQGVRVTLADGWSADLWLARQMESSPKEVPGALYPEFGNAEFIGLLNLRKRMNDLRGQAIAAGVYTLRYQLLPQDANHMGISPNPDFVLAIPAAADPNPAQHYLYRKFVTLSAKSTGTGHPAAIALEQAAETGGLSQNAQGWTVLTVNVPGAAPKKIGIVLRGSVAQ